MIHGKGFEIIISSDTQYEKLCAEIYFDSQFVAIITQEESLEMANIEIYSPVNTPQWTFNFSEFFNVLREAKNKLEK
jgi:hypothetical protein